MDKSVITALLFTIVGLLHIPLITFWVWLSATYLEGFSALFLVILGASVSSLSLIGLAFYLDALGWINP